MMKNICLYLLLMLLFSCTAKSIPDEVIHPVPERLPPDESIGYTIDIEEAPQNRIIREFTGYIHSTINQSVSGTELFEVEDVTIDSHGYLYVRTKGSNTIEVYGFDGVHFDSIGRDGNGPGEFNYMWAMDFDSSFEHLYVLDTNEIEVFSRSEDGTYTPANTIYHGLTLPSDLCVFKDKIYVGGFKIEALDAPRDPDRPATILQLADASIHSFQKKSGELLNSFGQLYKSYSGDPFLEGNLSRTLLSCNDHSNTVVGLFSNSGYFFGYTQEGGLKWMSKVENFNPMQIRESGINTPSPSYGGVPNTTADSFFPFRETDLQMELIQVKKSGNGVSTFYLNSETGELLHGGTSSTIPVSKTGDIGATLTLHDDEYQSVSIQAIEIE